MRAKALVAVAFAAALSLVGCNSGTTAATSPASSASASSAAAGGAGGEVGVFT